MGQNVYILGVKRFKRWIRMSHANSPHSFCCFTCVLIHQIRSTPTKQIRSFRLLEIMFADILSFYDFILILTANNVVYYIYFYFNYLFQFHSIYIIKIYILIYICKFVIKSLIRILQQKKEFNQDILSV